MSRRHLPPLNPLRHFEAAARHGSFTQAARELHVTTVAVSRQVAKLERYYKVALFHRLHHTLQLTRAGAEFLPKASAALDLIDEGDRHLRARRVEPLVVCSYPVFAIRWLIPRLPLFHAQHPDIEISVSSAIKPAEFDYGAIDVGIQYMQESPPSLAAEVILPDIIQPVCSPELLAGSTHAHPSRSDLRRCTLLRSRYRRLDWQEWCEISGEFAIEPPTHMTFKGSELAYQAAIDGLGIVVAQRLLVENEISRGNLVTPFSLAAQRAGGVCLVCKRQDIDDPRVEAFRTWIKGEAGHAMDAVGVSIASPSDGATCVVLA